MVSEHLNSVRRDCKTWPELNEAIESFSGSDPYRFLFRGHRQASWLLQPSIERICTVNKVLRTERQLHGEFQSKAHLYSPNLPPLSDTLSWFAVMQHHDVPTRLLDWSYSAYVALYFAVHQPSDEEHCVLWAIDHAILKEVSDETSTVTFGVPYSEFLSEPERFKPSNASFDASFGLIVPVLPRFHVSRLSSQQGCFLLNVNYLITFENSLAVMMKDKTNWLHSFTFPSALRVEALKRLMQMNIHPASLFPDLGGLAQLLVLKNELSSIR
jgi:hypothetical protein